MEEASILPVLGQTSLFLNKAFPMSLVTGLKPLPGSFRACCEELSSCQRWALITPYGWAHIYRWETWGPEKRGGMLKVTLLTPVSQSVAQSCPTHCDPMDCGLPGFAVHHNSQSLPKLMSIESSCLILCCPLLLLPSVFLSIRVFSSESALHIRWPKYWSFSFSISHSSEYSGLISFRTDYCQSWNQMTSPGWEYAVAP